MLEQDHAPSEAVLTRQRAGVSNIMHHMRINGDVLDHDLLASLDGDLHSAVSAPLCGNLPVHPGGRPPHASLVVALSVTLPAHDGDPRGATGASCHTIMCAYDTRTDSLCLHSPCSLCGTIAQVSLGPINQSGWQA